MSNSRQSVWSYTSKEQRQILIKIWNIIFGFKIYWTGENILLIAQATSKNNHQTRPLCINAWRPPHTALVNLTAEVSCIRRVNFSRWRDHTTAQRAWNTADCLAWSTWRHACHILLKQRNFLQVSLVYHLMLTGFTVRNILHEGRLVTMY